MERHLWEIVGETSVRTLLQKNIVFWHLAPIQFFEKPDVNYPGTFLPSPTEFFLRSPHAGTIFRSQEWDIFFSPVAENYGSWSEARSHKVWEADLSSGFVTVYTFINDFQLNQDHTVYRRTPANFASNRSLKKFFYPKTWGLIRCWAADNSTCHICPSYGLFPPIPVFFHQVDFKAL